MRAPPYSPISSPILSPVSSASSSRLPTPLSRSPSPGLYNPYMTPPSSSVSEKGTCTPQSDPDTSTLVLGSSDRDGPPPKKRRRTGDSNDSKLPRETKRLNFERMARDSTLESSVQLDRLLKALRKKRKIVVVAGAGISVSAGIPDFRSSTGLFKSLKETHNLKGSGKQLFDAGVYRDADSTSTFHSMVREMSTLSAAAEPTAFHHLIARLAHEGRLLRLYTQNVDGLENKLEPLRTEVPLPAKGPWPRSVQLHGGLEKMICSKCSKTSDFDATLFDQDLPAECADCQALDHTRTEVAGKRSHGVGRLRPRMTLYNETGPDDDAIGAVSSSDLKTRPDCVLVVGTTLSVPGVRRIVRQLCAIVRDRKDGLSVWVNLEQEPAGKDLENAWDLIVTGKADELAVRAGLGRWDDPEIVEIVNQLDGAKAAVHVAVPSPRRPNTYFDPIADAVKTAEAQDWRMATPASKGRKLEEVLGRNRTATGDNKKKAGRPVKKVTAKMGIKEAKVGREGTTKKPPVKTFASIKTQFRTSKAGPGVEADAKEKEKERPLSDIENATVKGVAKAPAKKRQAKQLDEVPSSDERVNSPTKGSSRGLPSFPGLTGKA